MVAADVVREPISAGDQREVFGQRRKASVLVGDAAADGRPLALLLQLEGHRDASCWTSKPEVQYMRRDHFSLLRRGPHPAARRFAALGARHWLEALCGLGTEKLGET